MSSSEELAKWEPGFSKQLHTSIQNKEARICNIAFSVEQLLLRKSNWRETLYHKPDEVPWLALEEAESIDHISVSVIHDFNFKRRRKFFQQTVLGLQECIALDILFQVSSNASLQLIRDLLLFYEFIKCY